MPFVSFFDRLILWLTMTFRTPLPVLMMFISISRKQVRYSPVHSTQPSIKASCLRPAACVDGLLEYPASPKQLGLCHHPLQENSLRTQENWVRTRGLTLFSPNLVCKEFKEKKSHLFPTWEAAEKLRNTIEEEKNHGWCVSYSTGNEHLLKVWAISQPFLP